MRCFVTVGSTKFDALIKEVLSENVLNILKINGFNQLYIQCGNGKIFECFEKSNIDEIWTYKSHEIDVIFFYIDRASVVVRGFIPKCQS